MVQIYLKCCSRNVCYYQNKSRLEHICPNGKKNLPISYEIFVLINSKSALHHTSTIHYNITSTTTSTRIRTWKDRNKTISLLYRIALSRQTNRNEGFSRKEQKTLQKSSRKKGTSKITEIILSSYGGGR